MKLKFYISKKDGSFTQSEGTLLDHDIVAHKVEGKGWRLTDYSSGMYVKVGLKSLKECREAVETMPKEILDEILRIRETESYKKKAAELVAYVKSLSSKPAVVNG